MAILERNIFKKPIIDLSGPNGNAYVLINYAIQLGRDLGFDKNKIEEIKDEMMSSDYEHLLKTFDDNFGHLVDLMR